MNSRVRLGLELVLVVAIFAVGLFAFNQYRTLTDTQSTLSDVETNSTALAEQANADVSTATQAAAEANSTSTENSIIIANNYGTETRVALVANANDQRLYATGTQAADDAAATSTQVANEYAVAQADFAATSTRSAENAANNLDNANATSTEAANNASTQLDNANATSTEAANMASTQLENANGTSTQAAENADTSANVANTEIAALNVQLTDLNNELTDSRNELADSRDEVATQGAELQDADATIEAQQEEIASLQENGGNGNGNGNGNTDELVLVEANNVEISLSRDYIIVNFAEDYDDILDELFDKGGAFESFAEFLEENEDVLELGAILSDEVDNYSPELMYIFAAQGSSGDSLEEFMDEAYSNLADNVTVDEQEVIELGGQELGRVILEVDVDFDLHQVDYIYKDGRTFWHIRFVTTSEDFDDRLEQFDASVATFRLR